MPPAQCFRTRVHRRRVLGAETDRQSQRVAPAPGANTAWHRSSQKRAASEARPAQAAEKRCRFSGAGGGKEPSQPFSCSVFGSEGGEPTYLGARVSPRSCRPIERAAGIRAVPATCSLGSAWSFQGAPACPHKARWPSVRAAPNTGADGALRPACPGQFSSCRPTSPDRKSVV